MEQPSGEKARRPRPPSTQLFGPQGFDEISLDPVNIALAQSEHVFSVGRDEGAQSHLDSMDLLTQAHRSRPASQP